MKKLSLLLLTLCISLAGRATDNDDTPGLEYTLNPYAYDLKIKSWDESSQTLTVQFKLNAPPNLNGDEYNKVTDIEPNGIQIFAVDPQGNRYRIAGPGRDVIKTAHVNNNGQYELRIDLSTAKSVGGNNPDVDIPKNVPLTWEVQVKGRNNTATKGRKSPTLVFTDITTKNSHFYPRAAHGIAIEKKPLNPHFGKIFVADACIDHLKAAGYKYNGSALLIYDPHLKYTDYELKVKYEEGKMNGFSTTVNYEPHRVCVSEDGRVFVTCYNPDADAIVMELVGNDNFRTIIKADKAQNKDEIVIRSADGNNTLLYPADTKYNDRPIAMDVKKTDEGLKILVAMLTPKGKIATKGTNRRVFSKITCYEYTLDDDDVNVEQYNLSNGKCKVVAEFYDVATDGTNDGSSQGEGMLFQCVFNDYNSIKQGLINVKYGEGENNPIWMKVDFGFSKNEGRNGRILYFDNTGSNPTVPKYTYLIPVSYCNANAMYGGGGMYIKGNQLLTGSGNNSVLFFNINNSNSVPNLTYNTSLASGSRGTGAWIDAFAEDFAGNIYALSEAADNIIVIAMPYDGVRRTPSPAGQTFTISDPIPNIYATNLRYEAVEGAPKYKFSFNVNTQPKYAEIRFYKSYESMKKSLSIVNADNFKGGKDNRDADLYCYYPITSGLKCGKIEVEFDMVGGVINNKLLTNPKLPRGQLYWSVYVETDKSAVFAPIYRQPLTGTDAHYRLHATVNNYPETDQFGAVYAAQEDKRDANNKRSSLMIYEINDNGSDVHDLNNTTRYQKTHEYLYATDSDHNKAFPRRMTVAPDGLLYIAHQGDENQNGSSEVAEWKYGGIYTWNPNDSVNANGKIKLSLFSYNEIGTSSAVVLHPFVNGNDTTWNLYATNTYNEYVTHGQSYDTVAAASINKFGWNGFVEYVKDKNVNWETWVGSNTANYSLGRGDESGNVSLAATDYGMWLCQHREHNVKVKKDIREPYADNKGAYVLSFVPYGKYSNSSYAYGPRTWRSCTTDGGRVVTNTSVTTKNEAISDNSQTETAPLQSTPGGGMTYKKVKISDTKFNEYLYIVNHDGDIVQWKIEWADNNTRPRMYIDSLKILKTPTETKGVLRVVPTKFGGVTTDWTTAAITSMCFDFAGNLVTTTGVSYFDNNQLQNEASELAPEGGQNIIIYTMPYDRTNAREIQAPKSNIFIPERTAYLEDRTEMNLLLQPYVENTIPCYLDIFRPMPNTSFSTICLPFDLDMKQLTTEALKDAEVKRYTGLQLSDIGGEKMLELVFEDVPINGEGKQILEANTPYIIQPKVRIPGIIQLQEPIQFVTINEQSVVKETQVEEYAITFKGVIPTQQIEVNQPLTLLLVAENRLAEMVPDAGFTNQGKIHGFRGYFELNKPLNGIGARITPKQSVSTSTTIIVDGKRVNIEKYLREGRVYIRVGDSLYTMDGQLVK